MKTYTIPLSNGKDIMLKGYQISPFIAVTQHCAFGVVVPRRWDITHLPTGSRCNHRTVDRKKMTQAAIEFAAAVGDKLNFTATHGDHLKELYHAFVKPILRDKHGV